MTQLLPEPPLAKKPKPTWSLLRRHAMIVPKNRAALRCSQRTTLPLLSTRGRPVILSHSQPDEKTELKVPKLLRIPTETATPVSKEALHEKRIGKPVIQASSPLKLLQIDDLVEPAPSPVVQLIKIPPGFKRTRQDQPKPAPDKPFRTLHWPDENSQAKHWYAPTKCQLLPLETLLSTVPKSGTNKPATTSPQLLHTTLTRIAFSIGELHNTKPFELLRIPTVVPETPRLITQLEKFGHHSSVASSKHIQSSRKDKENDALSESLVSSIRKRTTHVDDLICSTEVAVVSNSISGPELTNIGEPQLTKSTTIQVPTKLKSVTQVGQREVGVQIHPIQNPEAVALQPREMELSPVAMDEISRLRDIIQMNGQEFLSLRSEDVSRWDCSVESTVGEHGLAVSSTLNPPSIQPEPKRISYKKKDTGLDNLEPNARMTTSDKLSLEHNPKIPVATLETENKMHDHVESVTHPEVAKMLSELDSRLFAVDKVSIRLEEEYKRNQQLLENMLRINAQKLPHDDGKTIADREAAINSSSTNSRTQAKQKLFYGCKRSVKPQAKAVQPHITSKPMPTCSKGRTHQMPSAGQRPGSAPLGRKREQARIDRRTALSARRCDETIKFIGQILADSSPPVPLHHKNPEPKLSKQVRASSLPPARSRLATPQGRLTPGSTGSRSPAVQNRTASRGSQRPVPQLKKQRGPSIRGARSSRGRGLCGPASKAVLLERLSSPDFTMENEEEQTTVLSDWSVDSNVKRILGQTDLISSFNPKEVPRTTVAKEAAQHSHEVKGGTTESTSSIDWDEIEQVIARN